MDKSESRETLGILVTYFVSVWFSIKYATSYAVVGPVFGLAVVSIDSKFFRNIIKERHVGFIVASTLVYALVYWVSSRKWESETALVNYLIGPFPLSVILGSVLLPVAHQFIFKKPTALTIRASISLIAAFYVITLFAYLYNEYNWGIQFSFIDVSIAVWQALYLYLFFSKKKRKGR